MFFAHLLKFYSGGAVDLWSCLALPLARARSIDVVFDMLGTLLTYCLTEMFTGYRESGKCLVIVII